MKLNRRNKEPVEEYGRVYVYTIDLEDGTKLWKVGMCESDRTIDRMMEVMTSFFKVYRYVPHARLRKDKKTLVPKLLERHIHSLLEEYGYKFDKKFSGYTEFFSDLDEDVLLDYLSNFDDIDFLKTSEPMETRYYELLVSEKRRRGEKRIDDTLHTNELNF